MKLIKHYFTLLFLSLTLVNAWAQSSDNSSIKNREAYQCHTPSFVIDGTDKPVRNIILMIGDGMGYAHVTAALFANHGALNMTNLKTMGMVMTQSADKHTTDSAASGTAYATGKKTKNGAIGVDPLGNSLENLSEKLSKLGYATGIATTDNIDGATPSAFYAHQANRGMSAEILGDLPNSPLTFFAGGSAEHVDKTRPSLTKELEKVGFVILKDIKDNKATSAKRIGYLPAASETASVNDGRGDFLPSVTTFATNYLKCQSKKGFFLMVEGARIDKSAHDNDFQGVVRETLDFDRAVEQAIRFAEADGQTLVIISADHETGGITLSTNGSIKRGETKGYFRNKSHSPIPVPMFVYGPQSKRFTGIMQNSDVSNIIYEILK